MPVPSAISELSTTPALNSPAGSESPSTLDDYIRTHASFIAQLSSGAYTLAPTVSSINGGQLAGMRNKIIGHFAENQRGLTSVADDAYCCDRWYVLTETGNVTVAQVVDPESGSPFGWKLTQPDAAPKRMGLATIIESKDIRSFRSVAMNFFVRVKPSFTGNVRYAIIEHTGTADAVTSDVVSNWASATFTPSNFFIAGINVIKTGTVAPGAATYGEISDWAALGASTNNVILFVWSEAAQAQNATLELNRPQYEPGVIHTPHEFRLNELALCQRYYEESGSGDGSIDARSNAGGAGQPVLTTFNYKVTKRSTPTAIIVGTWGVVNSSQPTILATGVNAVTLFGNSSAAGLAYVRNDAAGNKVTVSSEL